MVNVLQNASEHLKDKRDESMSVLVLYERPSTGESISNLKASPGSTPFRVMDEAGRFFVIKSTDFLISRELLLFGSTEVEPIIGDRITWNGFIYEVFPFNNEPEWRWTSAYRYTRRIHTKKVGET